nr:AEC family transporter [Bacillus sp. ISL-55]
MVLLPVFSIFAIGFVGQKVIGFDPRSLSKMAIYLLSPFLAFRTFYENEINLNYLYLTIYALGLCFGLISIVYAVSFIKKYSRTETSSLILSSAFMNNGNYGTPVVLFVFGESGFDIAVILLVIQQLIMSTIGVYYAAKGSDQQDGIYTAFKAVAKMPIVYGSLLGIVFQLLEITIDSMFYKSINLVADAAIPTIMVILGMQLAKISLKKLEVEKLSYSLIIKLMVAPILALIFASILPVSEEVKDIMILLAAMPSATNTTMYALQFNTRPVFVSTCTLISTLSSIITLPVILNIIL